MRGEISGYRGPHSSGHAYFALKDDRARLEAVIWKTTMARLRFRPEEGMEVIATGKLTTYPGSSKYQIVIENLEPAGAGALMALLEERKRKLQPKACSRRPASGACPSCRRSSASSPRRPEPSSATSSTASRTVSRSMSSSGRCACRAIPSGAEATAAVQGFNALAERGSIPRPDVLIVARGGGSLEDLWGFNDEALARAVAASAIPVISAVGHETDWTLIDFVADMRAPTPTGAAEMAVPVKAELEATVASLHARLRACTSRGFDRRRQALRAAARALPSPDQLLALPRRRFDEATSRLSRALVVSTERKRARLGAIRLSPAVLGRRVSDGRKQTRGLADRLLAALRAEVRDRRARFERDARRFDPVMLTRRHLTFRDRLGALQTRSDRCVDVSLERRFARLVQADRLLSTLSYQAVLERGFAVVADGKGELVKAASAIAAGERLELTFADGKAKAIATGEAARRPQRTRLTRKAADAGGQGSLF